jgi:hypothetical protein
MEPIRSILKRSKELDEWTLVEKDGRPNFELRFSGSKFTGDVYYALVKERNFTFMNIRTRDQKLVEYYPSAGPADFDLFPGFMEGLCDLDGFAPYVSKTPGGEPTHLYCVASDSHQQEGDLAFADRRILRWSRDNSFRTYAMVTSSRDKVKEWSEVFWRLRPNYVVFYYDGSCFTDYLAGFNTTNPSYNETRRLFKV